MSRLTSQPPPPHPTSRSFVSCSWGNLQLLTVVWSLASYFPRWSWQSARDSSFRISAGFLHRTSAYSCLLAASCGGWGGGGVGGGTFLAILTFPPFVYLLFDWWMMTQSKGTRWKMVLEYEQSLLHLTCSCAIISNVFGRVTRASF